MIKWKVPQFLFLFLFLQIDISIFHLMKSAVPQSSTQPHIPLYMNLFLFYVEATWIVICILPSSVYYIIFYFRNYVFHPATLQHSTPHPTLAVTNCLIHLRFAAAVFSMPWSSWWSNINNSTEQLNIPNTPPTVSFPFFHLHTHLEE